jgi:hypothetical protein
MTEQTAESVERALHDELVRGDASIAAAGPVLRHLLADDDGGLLSDETVARVRGMTCDLAEQLLFAQAAAAEANDVAAYIGPRREALAQALFEDAALLAHAHGLAIEGQLMAGLQSRAGIDPVLTPLVQELAASTDGDTASLAMAVLASQARFEQHQRRMELPLEELPGKILHSALLVLRSQAGGDEPAAEVAEGELRARYDEGAGRLGLIARLVLGLGKDMTPALRIAHAGLSIFATAVSLASRQDRGVVVLSCAGRQRTRLALSLRASDLDSRLVTEQMLLLDPYTAVPGDVEAVRSDRAVALLAASLPETTL